MPTRDMTNLSHVTAWSAAGAGRGGGLTTRARPRGISMIKMTIALFKQFKQSEGGGGNGWDMPPTRCLQHWPGPGPRAKQNTGRWRENI